MHSSVKQAHTNSSLSPISEAFDIMRDDTTEHAYKQNKSTQQKQYRDREVDSFAELREAIREVTDDQEAPRTKYETLSKAAQHIRQLSMMNLRLHQQLHMLKSSRMNDEGCMMTHTQVPAMSLHRKSDVKSAGMRQTTEIVPQSMLDDFFIGVSSGVCDAAVLEGAQDQTNIISRRSDNLSQINQYTARIHSLNQSPLTKFSLVIVRL
ncbi:hypothetical protein EDB19DRAFT_1743964 [Suillus lakei]|nr:hypothetical protein EDB19DRAFT_1743964 [Suillus lakei]